MVSKGKEVIKDKGKSVAGIKRGHRGGFGDENDKTGGDRKRRNRDILQFFEDTADIQNDDDEDDYDDFSDFDPDDLFGEEYDIDLQVRKEQSKAQSIPVVPKEEEMDEEEFDKMMEERYKSGSRFVTHAEDAYESKKSVDGNTLIPSSKDPTLWKVKCLIGRERHSAFCLMQKFVDLKALGTKLEIISAFAVDHVKGFIYIEAEKQGDINEACKGLSTIYSSRLAPVPRNDVSHLLTVKSKNNEVTAGMWGRVKYGKYKGDLAQIVAVNNEKKKATIKVIPRIDLQALAQKFGGGVPLNKNVTPSPRLLSSNELEEFRPLIQFRRDRDTGNMYEVLDGLMFKDGYLYKKVPIDSLNCWGVVPTEEELLKFTPSETNDADNLEWLTQLYGGRKKKRIIGNEKGNEKGGSSAGSSSQKSFELYELVYHGRKSFGLIVGFDKDDYYKILKEGPEGSVVENVAVHELKTGPADMKFTALDQNKKNISINDSVKVLEGPLKGRQGIVKQIYRGILFVNDENDTDNGGYFCCKAQMCEKIKLFSDVFNEKDGVSSSLAFEDFPSSPKSPLSPKRPLQSTENSHEFNRGNTDGIFSVGQTLRIRIGPLKGFLCRVLAIRYSEVTVKVDSQHRVLTVKSEHLTEVRDKSSTLSRSDDPGCSSFKSFDLLGTEGWTGGGTSTEGDGWNSGGLSNEGSSWHKPSSSGFGQILQESSSANPWDSTDNVPKKDAAWETKDASNQDSSWGVPAADNAAVTNTEQIDGWGTSGSRKTAVENASSAGASDGWNKSASACENPVGTWETKDASNQDLSWGVPAADNSVVTNSKQNDGWGTSGSWKTAVENASSAGASDGWNKAASACENPVGTSMDCETSWVQADGIRKNQLEAFGKDDAQVETGAWGLPKSSNTSGDTWGNAVEAQDKSAAQEDSWSKATEKSTVDNASSGSKNEWGNSVGKQAEGSSDKGGSWSQQDSGWNDKATGLTKGGLDTTAKATAGWNSSQNQTESWNTPKAVTSDGGSWNKQDGESSWGKQGKSAWSHGEGNSSWNKQDGESSCGKQTESTWSHGEGNSSWNKQDGGSNWNKRDSDQGYGGWNKSFDGDRGSGGRGGRGGRGSGNQFGSGRSNDEDYSQNEDNSIDGGSWKGGGGGFRGRGGGGFGGRGRSDRGGYRGRGERGGFGGRNSSDRSDRGGRFGGRSGRGGFNSRGNGRREYDGWRSNDSDQGKSFDWKSGADNAGSWKNQGGSNSWSSETGGNLGWSSSTRNNDNSNVDNANGWSKGVGAAEGERKSSDSTSKGQWDSWNSSSKGTEGSNGWGSSSREGGGWGSRDSGSNKTAGSGDTSAGGWGSRDSGLNRTAGSGDTGAGGWGSQDSGWSKSAGSGDTGAGGWGQSEAAKQGGSSGGWQTNN